MNTQQHLTVIATKQLHPRREPKYYVAYKGRVCLGANNSIKLLKHTVRTMLGSLEGVTTHAVR